MNQKTIRINSIKCDYSKYNKIEINLLQKKFLSKQAIPSPWVNKDNEVIAFHNSFFVLKELNIPEISVVLN